jgi:hypothetical protein
MLIRCGENVPSGLTLTSTVAAGAVPTAKLTDINNDTNRSAQRFLRMFIVDSVFELIARMEHLRWSVAVNLMVVIAKG